MPVLRIKQEDWWHIVEAVRGLTGKDTPAWVALMNYYGVCLPSIITQLSHRLWYLHRRINGTGNETYRSFYNLPAFWVDACDVIDNEIARIDKVRTVRDAQKYQALIKSVPHGK